MSLWSLTARVHGSILSRIRRITCWLFPVLFHCSIFSPGLNQSILSFLVVLCKLYPLHDMSCSEAGVGNIFSRVEYLIRAFLFPPPRCDYCAQRRRGHRPGRLHHQEAQAGSSRVSQAGYDLQRSLPALLLHAVHRGLRKHQPGRNQHPLHHRVRRETGRGEILGRWWVAMHQC